MALWHNRQPNLEMNNSPDKQTREERKTGREAWKADQVAESKRERGYDD